jgi:hypothetical protein
MKKGALSAEKTDAPNQGAISIVGVNTTKWGTGQALGTALSLTHL